MEGAGIMSCWVWGPSGLERHCLDGTLLGFVTVDRGVTEYPPHGLVRRLEISNRPPKEMEIAMRIELASLTEIELQILECLPPQNPPAIEPYGADMDEIASDVLNRANGRTRAEIKRGLDSLMRSQLATLVQFRDDDGGRKKLRWRYGYCVARGKWRDVQEWLSPKTAP
jgi:hypothetical protein